jgi:primase-polymerase (primpol)-like protein
LELFPSETKARDEPTATAQNEQATRSDEEVERLCRTRQKRNFTKLFDEGSLADYGGDASDADLELCVIITRYTDDNAMIERIMGRSKLKRDKWYERRGDSTYLARTIAKRWPPSREDMSRPRGESNSSRPLSWWRWAWQR